MYIKQWQFIVLSTREKQKYRKKGKKNQLPNPYDYEKGRTMFM